MNGYFLKAPDNWREGADAAHVTACMAFGGFPATVRTHNETHWIGCDGARWRSRVVEDFLHHVDGLVAVVGPSRARELMRQASDAMEASAL